MAGRSYARPEQFRNLHRELERQATLPTPGSPWARDTGQIALRQATVGGRDVMVITLAAPPHELLTPAELGRLLGLSPRLAEVAFHVASRRSNREIARAMDISEATVRTHTSRIFNRLGIHNRRRLSETVHRCVLDALQPRPAARRSLRSV